MLISTPSPGVYYCQQLTLSVCPDVSLSVTHLQIASYFFVSRWNRAIFWPSVLHVALCKTLFFDFCFMPPNAQNLLLKICTKIAYNSACMADRPEMFGANRGFSGMADSIEPCKILRADPCCHGNEICTKSPITWLVWQIDRRCFGLLGDFRG